MTANQNPYKGIYKCKARYCGGNSELKDATKQFQISTPIRVLSSFDIFNPHFPLSYKNTSLQRSKLSLTLFQGHGISNRLGIGYSLYKAEFCENCLKKKRTL